MNHETGSKGPAKAVASFDIGKRVIDIHVGGVARRFANDRKGLVQIRGFPGNMGSGGSSWRRPVGSTGGYTGRRPTAAPGSA